ncbi:diacylglycerol kinase [Candidatus Uhrbacteria bacterium]|nr:diacylglycerol kinase [Candidatus Uhrbacteria bacterium]
MNKALIEIGKSFSHAWDGLLTAFRDERSFRILVAATLVVCIAITVLPLESWERILLLMVTATMLVLELVNSMVERLVDLVKPRLHSYVKEIKDLMAAAVLVAAAFAAVIGALILAPYVHIVLGRV